MGCSSWAKAEIVIKLSTAAAIIVLKYCFIVKSLAVIKLSVLKLVCSRKRNFGFG
jgi:hypothetical protein